MPTFINKGSKNNILNCVNCGHIVSTNAESCPQCAKENFRGKKCELCNQRSSKNELIKLNSHYTLSKLTNFYAHEECLHHLLRYDDVHDSEFFCNDCQSPIQKEKIKTHLIKSYKSTNDCQFSCAKCGSVKPASHLIESCFFCGTTILKKFHKYETVKIKANSFYYKHSFKEVTLHKRCVSKVNSSIVRPSKNIFKKAASTLSVY